MSTLVANRAKFGHGYSQMKQGWGHEIAHEYHVLGTEGVIHLGAEEDLQVGFLASAMRSYFENFPKHYRLVAGNQDDWYHLPSRRRPSMSSSENLRHRLENANSYFRRKASAVFNDQAALTLLESLYEDVVVDISDFDACENGVSLAKLTAANFCEVGANVIHITDAGQRFIGSLRDHGQV